MAAIRIEPSAARAVISNMKSSAIELEISSCECFAGHDSQSAMMSKFEDRVSETIRLIERYQELLVKDVHNLQDSCDKIIERDKLAGKTFSGASSKGSKGKLK